MLTYDALVDLEHSLNDHTVLSIYINGEETDPAKRRRWRIELKNALDAIAASLHDAPAHEREAFAAARAAAERRVNDIRGLVRAPGWCGFFTHEHEHHAGPVPAGVPTLASWTLGPTLTPYIRALKEARPVIVLLVDSRSARIFRYAERTVHELETLRAEPRIEPVYHMSRPPRPGFHPGTRGSTGTDEAQRDLHEATSQMLGELAEKVARLANNDAWVVVGGIPTVAAAALARLPEQLASRAMQAEGLDVHAGSPEIGEWARRCASALRERMDLAHVTEALDSAAANGLGAVGTPQLVAALDQGSARELLFTPSYLERHPTDAEMAVRKALGTRAVVEQVSGEAARRLDAAGGIAARLRYALPTASPPAS